MRGLDIPPRNSNKIFPTGAAEYISLRVCFHALGSLPISVKVTRRYACPIPASTSLVRSQPVIDYSRLATPRMRNARQPSLPERECFAAPLASARSNPCSYLRPIRQRHGSFAMIRSTTTLCGHRSKITSCCGRRRWWITLSITRWPLNLARALLMLTPVIGPHKTTAGAQRLYDQLEVQPQAAYHAVSRHRRSTVGYQGQTSVVSAGCLGGLAKPACKFKRRWRRSFPPDRTLPRTPAATRSTRR